MANNGYSPKTQAAIDAIDWTTATPVTYQGESARYNRHYVYLTGVCRKGIRLHVRRQSMTNTGDKLHRAVVCVERWDNAEIAPDGRLLRPAGKISVSVHPSCGGDGVGFFEITDDFGGVTCKSCGAK
jgi:hypothetical protein